MASYTLDTSATQAPGAWDVSLDAGETATVRFTGTQPHQIDWTQGGLSWAVEVDSDNGGYVEVEHSLFQSVDRWTPAPFGPYYEDRQGRETARIERIRFIARVRAARVQLLPAGTIEVDFS